MAVGLNTQSLADFAERCSVAVEGTRSAVAVCLWADSGTRSVAEGYIVTRTPSAERSAEIEAGYSRLVAEVAEC